MCTRMENASLLLNSSNTTDSLIGEFPFWQPTLAVTLFSFFFVLGGVHVVLYLPLLVTLLKSKKERRNSLNVLHISLLITRILEDFLRTFFYILYLPPIYRHCVCSQVVGIAFFSTAAFFSVYQPVTFACLGVLQFLVILGKRRLVNFKSACGMIALSIGVSLTFAIVAASLIHNSSERFICHDSYCPNSRPQSGYNNIFTKLLISLSLGTLLPSLIVVIIVSTWSCAIFKKYYTGGDDQLNRRMLSLPVIMPLTIVASTVLEVGAILLLGQALLMLSLGVYFPHWILFAQSQLLFFIMFVTRTVYPLMLIYTQPHLHQVFKKLLKRFKGTNSVAPSPSSSSQ